MKSKKLTLLAAAALMLSMGAPAFAAAPQTKVTAKVALPSVEIDVTLPTTSRTYINPKKLSISMNGSIVDGEILNEPGYIENRTTVPVSVSVSVTGKVKTGSKMKLSPSPTGSSTEKEAYVYFEMMASNDPEDDSWSGSKQIVLGATTVTEEDFIKLDAVDGTDRYGVFHLDGDCVQEPDVAWTAKDGMTATVAFTFRALPAER